MEFILPQVRRKTSGGGDCGIGVVPGAETRAAQWPGLVRLDAERLDRRLPVGEVASYALADFVAPADTGIADWMGLFALTTGIGLDQRVAKFEAAHDDYNAILIKALADRLAEAFAERLHERVRRELWGYAPNEHLDNAEIIREQYQGIRPAPGYPACPDHTEKGTLFSLLDATARTGIQLTESFAMTPTAAVSGYYFWRPEAQYFGVGKIERDQVEEYAVRKNMDLKIVERWLAPILNYDR